MELFHSGACFGGVSVFWRLCKRSYFFQPFWSVVTDRYFASAGRLVCVGLQETQGIMLKGNDIVVVRAFFLTTGFTMRADSL